jgi:hypothetical protein
LTIHRLFAQTSSNNAAEQVFLSRFILPAINDRTIATMSQLLRNKLNNDRILALILRALQHVYFVDGLPVLRENLDMAELIESERFDLFDYGELASDSL